MVSSGCGGLTVTTVCEEESVPLGQLEPGLENHGQPADVELFAGLDGDEDVVLADISVVRGEGLDGVGESGLDLPDEERVGPVGV